jgi:hypothetical protein
MTLDCQRPRLNALRLAARTETALASLSSSTHSTLVLFGSGLAALCLSVGALFPVSPCRGADTGIAATKEVVAKDFGRKTIYHSPQTPGYTCWLGAWIMPDKSLMICFSQNTGPLTGRARASEQLRKKLAIDLWKPERDATGLKKENLFFRSTDRGASWNLVGAISWEGPMSYISPGGQEVVLKDGTLLKGVFGYYQPMDAEVPQSAYILRSTNGARSWGKPEPLGDPSRETYRLTRLRLLRDGRIIATGGRARTPCTSNDVEVWKLWEPLLLVSDDNGRNWSDPVEFLTPNQRQGWRCEEYDTAELHNGDLLCVFRRFDPNNSRVQVRWQGLLKKSGKTWVLQTLGPSVLAHSGHPELLTTREGLILYISTEGVYWTGDGAVWTPVAFPGLKNGYHSRYYPKSVQSEEGVIYVFGHVGGDDDYGAKDQSVVMDCFRLSVRN